MVTANSCPTTQGNFRRKETLSPLRPRPKMSKATDAAIRSKLSMRFMALRYAMSLNANSIIDA
jgi:hypothetical protein